MDAHHRKIAITASAITAGAEATVGVVRALWGREVAWLLPEGRFTYWRGRAAHVEYDLDP